ncbi:MAG: acyltransferase family protein [Lachnospiraceae bacterium]|nr:acyltransferase family protein [Lachnospiraceae bacterium]
MLTAKTDNGDIQMDANIKKRLAGPDIVRALAAFFVVAAHFYLNVGYYQTPMAGHKMYIMTCARWFFISAMPMYMMLTGYFKSNKTVSKEHYKSLIPVLTAYLVITVIKVFVSNHFYGKIYYFRDTLKKIADYSLAWYVGMYIGLVVLIPFLNILWKALKTDKEKHILILSLVFICAVPSLIPYVVPGFFQALYPVMYYFMGVYVRENQEKIRVNKVLLICIAALMTLINGTISYMISKGAFFDPSYPGRFDNGYPALTVVICGACIFLLFYDINIENKVICGVLKFISQVSFEIYIFTGVFDVIIYSIAYRYLDKNANLFFWLFFAFVPLNFILSVLASNLYRYIYNGIVKLIVKRYRK